MPSYARKNYARGWLSHAENVVWGEGYHANDLMPLFFTGIMLLTPVPKGCLWGSSEALTLYWFYQGCHRVSGLRCHHRRQPSPIHVFGKLLDNSMGSNGLQWAPMGSNGGKWEKQIMRFLLFFKSFIWKMCLNNKFKSSGELFCFIFGLIKSRFYHVRDRSLQIPWFLDFLTYY